LGSRKNNRSLKLSFTQDMVDAIRWHIGPGYSGEEFLFSVDGTFPRHLDGTSDRCTLSHHQIGRHSVASQTATSGHSINAIQAQLGHQSGRLDSNQRPHAPKAKKPTKHDIAQNHETQQKPKHDRDLPAAPCLRFVTSYHWISHRHVNVRSTGGTWGRSLARAERSEIPGADHDEHHTAAGGLKTSPIR